MSFCVSMKALAFEAGVSVELFEAVLSAVVVSPVVVVLVELSVVVVVAAAVSVVVLVGVVCGCVWV